jgi:L-amino acid N-acyltransferase YncA
MGLVIRKAEPGDAAAIAEIYNQGIEERQATFDTEPRKAEDFTQRLADPEAPPFLVATDDDRVVAWARVGFYSDRDCYAGVGEASLYVDRGHRRRGAGRALLDALTDEAERRGYWKLIGLIFPTNAASVKLLERTGFQEVGLYRRHGRLDGEWRDVLLVERLLGPARR